MGLKFENLCHTGQFRFYAVCVGVGIVWACNVYLSRNNKDKKLPYPPGPRGLPIVGNFFRTSQSHAWIQAAELGKCYGDVVFIKSFGQKILYLNTYAAAKELLEDRSADYSSRPPMLLAREIGGWDWVTSLFPYGEPLRKSRIALARYFHPSVLHNYHQLQMHLVVEILQSILHSPNDYEKHIRRYPAALIMMITYGYKVEKDGDEYVSRADAVVRYTSSALEGMYVDVFPFLKYLPGWFPGMALINKTREGRKISQISYYAPYNATKENCINGSALPSITSSLIQEKDEGVGDLDDELIASIAGTMYIGASDTIVSAIITCVRAMVHHPNVMRRAQEELDRVVGKDSLPTFADRESLPYINAICLECLRWEMILPLGVSRIAERDDVYNGYLIPVGTVIYPNQWAMGMDANVYESPEQFKPERWLQEDQPLSSSEYAFGFGRRICPGKDFAESNIYIVVASLLACFDIDPDIDENGRPISPDKTEASMPGIVRKATAIKCRFRPRSDGIERLISASAASLN